MQEFKISQQVSIPNVSHVGVPGNPQGPTNYYHKYRLGVAMAASPPRMAMAIMVAKITMVVVIVLKKIL